MAELRMRDVIERTGMSRQAIHFYIEQGLVDPPVKTGATMAYYSEAHVERILLVRRLAEEHFLPLKAIRAMLDDKRGSAHFSRAQQRVLREVRDRLPPATRGTAEDEEGVLLAPLLARTGLARREVTELERAGLVKVHAGKVSADHAWLLELWGEVRAAGFTRELGVGPELLALFEAAIDAVFAEERKILARLAAALPPERVAEMVERALPLIDGYLARLHRTRVRSLFEALPREGDAS
jgi:DNA-binding transcriptional MerR regulator